MSTATIARARPVRGVRHILGQGSAAVVVAATAAGLTYYFTIHGSLLGLAAMVVVVGTVWFAATRHTTLALALLMLYLGALDGYLKLATGSTTVTFVRDFLLYGLVIGLLVRASATRRPLPAPPLSGWVFAISVLVMIQLFNPQNGSLLHSLAGVRQNLEFVPLFFLTFAFVRTKRALRTFVILFVLLATANGVVTVVQSRMSPQQLAAWGPGYAERVLGKDQFALGGRTFYDTQGQQHTRPFGLMSDAGTGGLVCALSLGCVLALASLRNRRRYVAPAGLAAVAVVAGIITSQGRAVLIGSFVVVLAYAAMVATSRGRLAMLASVAALSGVAYFAATHVFGGTATRYSGLTTSSIVTTTSQARGKAFASIPTNLIRHPLGSGLGSGGPAAGQSGAPADAETVNAENEISFATLEAGIPGMLVLIGFTVLVFTLGLRRCRHEPDPEARLLLAAIIAPVAALFAIYWVSALSPTSPGGPYLWSAGGIVSYWLIARPAERRARHAGPNRRRDPSGSYGSGPRRGPSRRESPVSSREPTISVVIATRDRPELLRRLADGLIAQMRPDDQLIVVDDATGAPASYDWLRPRGIAFRSYGRGPAVARNIGWRFASGDVVAFTDDDVRVGRGWLDAIRLEFAGNDELVGVEGHTVSRADDPLYEYHVRSNSARNGLTCNVAYRRTALEALGGLDEELSSAHCEDVDLVTRARSLGSVRFSREMIVEHELRPVDPVAFARRGGWLAGDRRLYAKNPNLGRLVRDRPKLRRRLAIFVPRWWHAIKAIPSLVRQRSPVD